MLNIIDHSPVTNDASPVSISNYAIILEELGAKYFKKDSYHLQVGEINQVQGWILHLSTVISQTGQMLKKVVPFLIQEKVAFKVVCDETAAEDVLNGYIDVTQIGKIVSIYPESDTAALTLAEQLVELTKPFKGPQIPTDINLGSIVYTRYGSHNPINKTNKNGIPEKFIYTPEGLLTKDPYSMPFQLPTGIPWPFQKLAESKLPGRGRLLNHVYKSLGTLKEDPKGNVYKGLYAKSLLQIRNCAIKQGLRNMNSDMAGRDMHDRLLWQYKLHKELSRFIPLPKVYDFFSEPSYTALIMEYVKGNSLLDKLNEINPLSAAWFDIPYDAKQLILKYIIEIEQIIDRMHKQGYVHRDINPVNFLIANNNKITLIDIELAYSLKNNYPNPPFKLGTPGFMSPEQEMTKTPTIFDDIYSLGATLLYIFTGLIPLKFNVQNSKYLFESLYLFTGEKGISNLTVKSLSPEPKLRPSIELSLQTSTRFRIRMEKTTNSRLHNHSSKNLNTNRLLSTINSAVKGLVNPPIVMSSDLWCSKRTGIENVGAPISKIYVVTPSLINGLSGVLYVLCRILKAGINIDSCISSIKISLKHIEDNYINHPTKIHPGLYTGAAGLAIALSESIRCGLWGDNEINRNKITALIDTPNRHLDLGNGIAGHAFSILKCSSLFSEHNFKPKLNKIISDILGAQRKNGLWSDPVPRNLKNKNRILNISQDDSGILWLLLSYHALYPCATTESVIKKGIQQIFSTPGFGKDIAQRIASKESYELGDGGKGLIRILIKSFEILRDDIYKTMAEQLLYQYPRHVVHSNYSQENGLAGLGELYLEAWRVFKNEEWQIRAYWIAELFTTTFYRVNDNCGHWVMDQFSLPTGSLMLGNSGLIHFLTRCYRPDTIGYRILT